MSNNHKPMRKGYLQNAYQLQLESSPDHFSKLGSSLSTSNSMKQDVWSSPSDDTQQKENKNKLIIVLKKYIPWMIGFCVGAVIAAVALAIIIAIWTHNMLSSTDSVTPAVTTTYWASGPLTNLDPSVLSSSGWTQCYNDTYAVNLIASQVATILSQCNQEKLLLACRSISNSSYTLAAMGLRSDVLYNCSSNTTCTHVANGVGWYFSDTYSWGFVTGNDSVTRNSCDIASTNPTSRLCWHTGHTYGGYRCGSTIALNSDTTWERSVWQAN